EAHHRASHVYEPGGAYAHGLDVAPIAQLADAVGDGLGDLIGVVGVRGSEGLLDDLAVVVHHARGDLGPADVHTDREHDPILLLVQVYVFHIVAVVTLPAVPGLARRGTAAEHVERAAEGREQLAARGHEVGGHLGGAVGRGTALAAGLALRRDGAAHGAGAADVLALGLGDGLAPHVPLG